jgi:septum formation protein
MKILLASNSPRRLEYLKGWGFEFESLKRPVEEVLVECNPVKTVMSNAYLKAFSLSSFYDSPVLGMDTVVFFDNKILGKPKNNAENKKMLEALSGNTHYVFTGIAIMYRGNFLIDYVKTAVTFRKLNSSEIETYVATHEGLDKAGGYAIQELASSFVVLVEGLLDNVIGVPVFAIRELLDKILELNI